MMEDIVTLNRMKMPVEIITEILFFLCIFSIRLEQEAQKQLRWDDDIEENE